MRAVPEPQKGSYSASPPLRWLRIGVSNRTSGFWVGWSSLGSLLPAMIILGDGACRIVAWLRSPREPDLGTLAAHHPAGLVAPVIPAPPHREEALVPDDLGHDFEADPLQPLGHLRGMDAGVPDVADDEGGHEFERFGPVDSGVARHRRVAGALSAHVCFLGRRAGVGHALVTG